MPARIAKRMSGASRERDASWNLAPPKTRVAIMMFDGVEIIDFAGPYEVFGQAGCEVHTVSRDGKAVRTAMNPSVNVDHSFTDATAADVILVPGNVRAAANDEATRA